VSDLLVHREARISPCSKYRYRLTREWGDGESITFVMLNPSTADSNIDDPTIRRCMAFARREGAMGIAVVNLFALRSTDPRKLEGHDNPYGPDNFGALGEVLAGGRIICAWGAHQIAVNPGLAFRSRAKMLRTPLWCLGRTREGHPRHPLYVRSSQPLEPFS